MPNISDRWALTVSEDQFKDQLMHYAKLRGWLRHHGRNSVQVRSDGSVKHLTAVSGDTGFPDVVFVHGETGAMLITELKSWTGRKQFRPGQEDWLRAFRSTGAPSFAATPMDFDLVRSLLDLDKTTWKTHMEALRDPSASLYLPPTLAADPKLEE